MKKREGFIYIISFGGDFGCKLIKFILEYKQNKNRCMIVLVINWKNTTTTTYINY